METIKDEKFDEPSLIQEAKNGSSEAFEQLFINYDRLIYTAVHRYINLNEKLFHEILEIRKSLFWDFVNKFDSSRGRFSTFIYDSFRWHFLNTNKKYGYVSSFSDYENEDGSSYVENYMDRSGVYLEENTEYTTTGEYVSSPCERSSRMEMVNLIEKDLENESERDRTIMSMYYSHRDDGKPYTLKEIGKAVNLSHEAVRLIHNKIIKKLKQKYV